MARGRKKQDAQELTEATEVTTTEEVAETTTDAQELTITFICNLIHNGVEYTKDSTHTMNADEANYFIQSNYATHGIHS